MRGPPGAAETRFKGKDAAILAVFAIVYLTSTIFMLDRFPKVWIDTAWSAIAPYTLVNEGMLANPMSPQAGLDQHILVPYVFHRLLLAANYKVFGFGLLQSRFLSVMCGLALLVITFWFTRKFFGRSVATITAAILVTENVFFVTSRTVRPDIVVTLLALSSLFLFLTYLHREDSPYLLFSSGLILGVATYTHPNALLFLVAILFLIFNDQRKLAFQSRLLWLFVAGFSVGLLPYVIYVFIEDWGSGFADFFAQLDVLRNYPRSSVADVLNSAYARLVHYVYFPHRSFIVLSQLIAVLYYMVFEEPRKRRLAMTVLIFLIFLPLVSQNPTPRYMVMITPILAILMAAGFVDLMGALPQNFGRVLPSFDRRKSFAIIWLILLIMNQAAGNMYLLWQHRNGDYQGVINQIRNVIPSHSRVWGNVTFWIGLHDYPYRSQLTPVWAIHEFRPEYLIVFDSEMWGNRSATLGRNLTRDDGFGGQRQAIEEMVGKSGMLVKEIADSTYGNIQIFEIQQP